MSYPYHYIGRVQHTDNGTFTQFRTVYTSVACPQYTQGTDQFTEGYDQDNQDFIKEYGEKLKAACDNMRDYLQASKAYVAQTPDLPDLSSDVDDFDYPSAYK